VTRLLTIYAVITAILLAQEGTIVNQTGGPEPSAYTSLFYYNSTDLQYTCKARSLQPASSFARTGTTITLTNIVVATNTATATVSAAHGLTANNKIVVSGATVDTDLNGTYALTSVGTTTLVFTTASVADATYTDATLVITTTAPRTTLPIWEVKKYTVAASLVTAVQSAVGISSPSQICGNRTTLSYQ